MGVSIGDDGDTLDDIKEEADGEVNGASNGSS